MRNLVARILFRGSPHVLEIMVTEKESKELMERYRSEAHQFIHGYDEKGRRHYTINCSEIAGIFTIDLEDIKKQQELQRQQEMQGQQPSKSPWGNSWLSGTN